MFDHQRKYFRRIHYIDDENIDRFDEQIAYSTSTKDRCLLINPRASHGNLERSRYSIKNPPDLFKITTTTNLSEMKSLSLSDSQINYKCLEYVEEAHGSRKYINRNGTNEFRCYSRWFTCSDM